MIEALRILLHKQYGKPLVNAHPSVKDTIEECYDDIVAYRANKWSWAQIHESISKHVPCSIRTIQHYVHLISLEREQERAR